MKRRLSCPESASFAQSFGAVCDWVCASGGVVAGVEPHPTERRIVACPDGIASGSTVLRIPDACLLRGIHCAKLRSLASLKCEVGDLALALSILAEKRRGGESSYAAYIGILPGAELKESLPAWWPETELDEWLGGSEVVHAARRMRDSAQSDALVLRSAELLSDDDELFFWALSCVTSRAFEAGEHGNVMVPLLDLLDHARPRQTAYEYQEKLAQEAGHARPGAAQTSHPFSEGGGGFVVTALRDLAPGVEVHNTYGAKGGRDLLLHYGFALVDNAEPDGSMNDCVRVEIKFEAGGKDAASEQLRRERWGAAHTRCAVIRCALQVSSLPPRPP